MQRYKIVVYGGGFAGCLMARMLADYGYEVDIVEATNKLGGMLRHITSATMHLPTQSMREFYRDIVTLDLLSYDQQLFRPPRGYEVFCQQLVDHKNISIVYHTPIFDPRYEHLYIGCVSTVSPDHLCRMIWRELPYQDQYPVRNEQSIQAHVNYQWVLSRLNIFTIGCKASFEMLSTKDIYRQVERVLSYYGRKETARSTDERENPTRPILDVSPTRGTSTNYALSGDTDYGRDKPWWLV